MNMMYRFPYLLVKENKPNKIGNSFPNVLSVYVSDGKMVCFGKKIFKNFLSSDFAYKKCFRFCMNMLKILCIRMRNNFLHI